MSGCASYGWQKSGADQAQFEQDRAQCSYEAAIATRAPASDRLYRSTAEAAARGASEGIAHGFREAELETLCLEARGYRRVRLP